VTPHECLRTLLACAHEVNFRTWREEEQHAFLQLMVLADTYTAERLDRVIEYFLDNIDGAEN